MNLCDPLTIKNIMGAFGLSFRKKYGQNFLTDKSAVESIAGFCAGDDTKTVLEIGPGFGALTHELAVRYEKVVALEIDRGLIPLLAYTLADDKNVSVIEADVMKADLASLLKEDFARGGVAVCANLPYYITTPILLKLLSSGLPFESITVTVQAEVADRLCAAPGTPDYGSLTVYSSYYGRSEKLAKLPPSLFLPPPSVESAVVKIAMYREKPCVPQDEELFFGAVRGAFCQRRKTLANALSSAFPDISKSEIAAAAERAGISPTARGETLSCSDFVRLSDELAAAEKAGTAGESEA